MKKWISQKKLFLMCVARFGKVTVFESNPTQVFNTPQDHNPTSLIWFTEEGYAVVNSMDWGGRGGSWIRGLRRPHREELVNEGWLDVVCTNSGAKILTHEYTLGESVTFERFKALQESWR